MRKIEEESTAGVDYPGDCKRLQVMIREDAGYHATLLECQDYWEWESEKLCAGWLTIDDDHFISEWSIKDYLNDKT
tara:strand:+ start:144 stop:371 length:228 start_codon:yes stop_codon:yes gene_type:complete